MRFPLRVLFDHNLAAKAVLTLATHQNYDLCNSQPNDCAFIKHENHSTFLFQLKNN